MKKSNGKGFSIKTGCLLVVLLGLLIYGALALVQCAKDNQGTPPAAETAPYLVNTTSRVYLAQSGVVIDSAGNTIRKLETIIDTYSLVPGESLILTNWYDKNSSNKWKYHKGDSPKLVQTSEGNVTITKREIKTGGK